MRSTMLTFVQLIVLFLQTRSSNAEKLFHNRDHSDVQIPGSHYAPVITDEYKAELFLSRYGFIEPVPPESENQDESSGSGDFLEAQILEGSSLLDSRSGLQSDHRRSTPYQAFVSALREFQKVSGLPVTGVFDDATKEAMNTPRCGVPDKETDPKPHPALENGLEENVSPSSFNESPEGDPFGSPDTESLLSSASNDTNINTTTVKTSAENSSDSLMGKASVDSSGGGSVSRRQRRDVSEAGFMAFSKSVLRWRLIGEGYSSQLSVEEQRYIFRLAFRMWSEVSPLEFLEDTTSPLPDVDIKLGFGTGRHLGCTQRFDGTGQEFAHAWFLGDIHFDDDEHFTAPNSHSGISLLKVAVHEIGHVLGLPHIYRAGSIMQPSYLPHESSFEMDWMDRKAIQHLYGGCRGRFNTVFDWIRKEKTPDGKVIIRFNTYFMRDGWYWLYENRNNRTRFGDPVALQTGWRGLPSGGVDAYVHVWSRKMDAVYFFKGTQFWRYDTENDEAFKQDSDGHRYPRPISEGFPGVPSPINTAFYDRRDSHIYFFKHSQVYAFNVQTNSLASGFPKNIRDVFPPVRGGDHPDGDIDAAYFSYTHSAVFLLKGTGFWRAAGGRERRRRPSLPRNGLLPRQEVERQWFDICDVHPSALKLSR